MNNNTWKEVTTDGEEGERWVRVIDDKCWISALHRRTGFGWMAWETAIVFLIEEGSRTKRWASDDRDVLIVAGDWRDELGSLPKESLRAWYEAQAAKT